MAEELPIDSALPFDPVLPVNYLSMLVVGALLSLLVTEEARTPLLRRVNRVGCALREGLVSWVPGHGDRSARARGALAIALVLVARLVITTGLRSFFAT